MGHYFEINLIFNWTAIKTFACKYAKSNYLAGFTNYLCELYQSTEVKNVFTDLRSSF